MCVHLHRLGRKTVTYTFQATRQIGLHKQEVAHKKAACRWSPLLAISCFSEMRTICKISRTKIVIELGVSSRRTCTKRNVHEENWASPVLEPVQNLLINHNTVELQWLEH